MVIHILYNFITSGDPVKMASVGIGNRLPPTMKIEQLSYNLTALLPCLPVRSFRYSIFLWSLFLSFSFQLFLCRVIMFLVLVI